MQLERSMAIGKIQVLRNESGQLLSWLGYFRGSFQIEMDLSNFKLSSLNLSNYTYVVEIVGTLKFKPILRISKSFRHL